MNQLNPAHEQNAYAWSITYMMESLLYVAWSCSWHPSLPKARVEASCTRCSPFGPQCRLSSGSLRSAALQTKWRLLVFLPSFLWGCRRSWCTRCPLRSARKSKCRPFRCSFHPRWRSRAAEVIDDCSAAVISLAIPKSLILRAPSFPSRMFDGFAVDYSAAADVLHAFCDLVECEDKIDSAGPANEASQFLLYALRSLLWDWKLESFDIRFLLLRMRFHLRELALFLQA